MSTEKKRFKAVHYHEYLQLNKLLGSQGMKSQEFLEEPAHDEMLFIIMHQAYELWFKQIIHELSSVMEMFSTDSVDEKSLGIAVHRLERITEIQKLMIQQINVLETMTPLDFLDFRNLLVPASGFQSFQFRMMEVMLGLQDKKRLSYHGQHYSVDLQEEQRTILKTVEEEGSLFSLIESWLERTPFLDFKGYNFLDAYKTAVDNMIESNKKAVREADYLTQEEIDARVERQEGTREQYKSIFNPELHQELIDQGEIRLSHSATLAALLINLYRDEPILHGPFKLLTTLVDMDELFTSWRYRHAQMVLRMLGKKMGTGGSSGHKYLKATAANHHVYKDLHNISTLLIPRSELPVLPVEVREALGFKFSAS